MKKQQATKKCTRTPQSLITPVPKRIFQFHHTKLLALKESRAMFFLSTPQKEAQRSSVPYLPTTSPTKLPDPTRQQLQHWKRHHPRNTQETTYPSPCHNEETSGSCPPLYVYTHGTTREQRDPCSVSLRFNLKSSHQTSLKDSVSDLTQHMETKWKFQISMVKATK